MTFHAICEGVPVSQHFLWALFKMERWTLAKHSIWCVSLHCDHIKHKCNANVASPSYNIMTLLSINVLEDLRILIWNSESRGKGIWWSTIQLQSKRKYKHLNTSCNRGPCFVHSAGCGAPTVQNQKSVSPLLTCSPEASNCSSRAAQQFQAGERGCNRQHYAHMSTHQPSSLRSLL